LGSTIQNFQLKFSPPLHFFSACLEVCTKYYHTKNNLQINAEQPPFGSDNVTTYTKDLTIDIQDPGHTLFPTEIQYTRTSDDIRICDFTCLPNLNIAETKNKPTPNSIYDAMRNWLNCNFFGPILLKSEKNCTRREKLVLFFCSAENLILDSPLNINFSTVHLAIKLNISLLRNWDSNTLTWHRIMDNFKRESFPTGRIVSIPATPLWCWDYGFTNFSTMAPPSRQTHHLIIYDKYHKKNF